MVPRILNTTEHRHISIQNSVAISTQYFLENRLDVRDRFHGTKFPRSDSFRFQSLEIREGWGARSSDSPVPQWAAAWPHRGGKQCGARYAVENMVSISLWWEFL